MSPTKRGAKLFSFANITNLKLRKHRTRQVALFILLLSTTSLLPPLLYTPPLGPNSPSPALGQAWAPLTKALSNWRSGPMPPSVITLLRQASSRDAAAAAISSCRSLKNATVVDTAQDGSRDVTLMAVERGAARVIVLDADELHLGALRELGRGVSSTVQVVHGVAGYTDSVRRVRRFASSRGDSCGGGNDSVHEYSIDGLMQADTGRIALMKVGASEFAVDVLKGALMTLAGGAIDVVMVELQVNMFQSREAVWELLWILVVQHKLQCSYLGFVDSDGVAIAVKTFHEVPLKESSLSSFVKFVFGVTLEGGQEAVKTEIFCAKARRAMWWM